MLRLVHLSDLHFSEGTSERNRDHCHSITHLLGLERVIKEIDFDFLVVSGDISNLGDEQSLLNARSYLTDKLQIGGGKTTGLGLPISRLRIIPGNHDAWNLSTHGNLHFGWQRSLDNYHSAFPEFTLDYPPGCRQEFVHRNGMSVFFTYLDSCYLKTEEDGTTDRDTAPLHHLVARGQISRQQTEHLLEQYDKGLRGNLLVHDQQGPLDKGAFASSLKVLVMHHYVLEPALPTDSMDYFLKLRDRQAAFYNIALSDTDVLLCGHRHLNRFDIHSYADNFDSRARFRYLLNCYRRLIGIASHPVQYTDSSGRYLSRFASAVLGVLLSYHRSQQSSRASVKDLAELLYATLNDPTAMRRIVTDYHLLDAIRAAHVDPKELSEIRRHIEIMLRPQDRQRLSAEAKRISWMVRHLGTRPFIQVMSGSSCKATSSPNKVRSFNVYEITSHPQGHRFLCKRYLWKNDARLFEQERRTYEEVFRKLEPFNP